jgi:hypothetical protein
MNSITIRSPLDYQNAVVELIKRRTAHPSMVDPEVQALTEAIEHYECVTRSFWEPRSPVPDSAKTSLARSSAAAG